MNKNSERQQGFVELKWNENGDERRFQIAGTIKIVATIDDGDPTNYVLVRIEIPEVAGRQCFGNEEPIAPPQDVEILVHSWARSVLMSGVLIAIDDEEGVGTMFVRAGKLEFGIPR